MSKLRVAILFGGKSVEHEISIRSAQNISDYIDRNLFSVTHIGITGAGEWFLTESVDSNIRDGEPVNIQLTGDERGFATAEGVIPIDIVFPALHGTDGEDGSIQGMLTSLEIPFVGTGVLGSSLSMNKLYSKKLLQASGVPISKFVYFTHADRSAISYSDIVAEVGSPFMLKAANLGSSVGVFKISEEAGFQDKIDEVFQYDHTLLCEEFVSGRELECAVMGNLDAQASLPGEIIVSDSYDFYTYEAKYEDPDAVEIVVPASLSENVAEEIRRESLNTYRTLYCEDYARVDLFLADDGRVLINEINTIPGFTNASMFPMMWNHHGISFQDLISKLINLALERNEALAHITNSRKN